MLLRRLTFYSVQKEAAFFEKVFSELLNKQPDISDRTGTSLRMLYAFSLFFPHVVLLPDAVCVPWLCEMSICSLPCRLRFGLVSSQSTSKCF
jgi:hypothetical protein